jgi:glutamine synthetase
VLKRNLELARKDGFTFYLGPELEYFYLPSDTETTLLDRGGYFDILPTNQLSMARKQTMLKLLSMGIRVEASHHEVAPGQHEIDFVYDKALRMADQIQVVKLIVKEYARLHGLYATFMPKPVPGVNGTGMHVHQSLFRDGENVFYNGNDPYQLSSVGRGYIAGLLKYAREITAVTNQWVNSYKRLVPGYEAPVYVSWGRTNRSALVRVPAFKKGKPKSCRAEYRAPDPGCNPYLCFSVMLRAGLAGIDEGLELPPPMEQDIFHMSNQERDDSNILKFNCSIYFETVFSWANVTFVAIAKMMRV